jgi:hypothetical protein
MLTSRLRRRASLMLDPLEIKPPSESIGEAGELANVVWPKELAVRERTDGTYEALDDEALMHLIREYRSRVCIAVLAEAEGDENEGMFVPRFSAHGGGYVFREPALATGKQ